MTTNTPEAWEKCLICKGSGIADCDHCEPGTHDCGDCLGDGYRHQIPTTEVRSLLHTTKVELLREVSQMFDDLADVGLEPALEKSAIHSLASRHGITEEELGKL